MFSKQLCFVFLSLALFANAIPQFQRQSKCGPVSTVRQTVTVTGRALPTGAPNNNNGGNNNNNGGNNNNNGGGNNNGGNNNEGNNGGNGGNNGNNDPQTSLTLDPKVIADGFANDGQDIPAAGQVPSLTSRNNFINHCLTVPNLPITNGKQITSGSCNPNPIGVIPSVDNMPSSKFVFPKNFGTIKAGETFTVEMAIQKMQTGFFVNAQANYFAAPQTLNNQGQIQGHSHVVIEQLDSLDQITPTDPKKFAFFKGLNEAAQNGKLSAVVQGGLAPGFYKMSSINSAANHQPVIVPVAQHGSLDDAVYFTVTPDGNANGGNNNGQNQNNNNGQNQNNNNNGQNQNNNNNGQNQNNNNGQNQNQNNNNKNGQNRNNNFNRNRFNRFRNGGRRSFFEV